MDARGLFDLKGRVAIITGAASGLGEAIAKGYAQYGASVAVLDVNEAGAQRVAQEITGQGGDAIPVVCNVADSGQVKTAVGQVIKKYGKIDILFNNAGIVRRSLAENLPENYWDEVIAVNLKGPFLLIKEVGNHMIARGKGGRIISTSSTAALVGIRTGNINYCASKGGLISMSRCLAIEWAKHNILVNVIAPSHFLTPLDAEMLEKKPEIKEYFINSIPLRRLGNVPEIVGPAIFLASEASSFITGHILIVDGGNTAE